MVSAMFKEKQKNIKSHLELTAAKTKLKNYPNVVSSNIINAKPIINPIVATVLLPLL